METEYEDLDQDQVRGMLAACIYLVEKAPVSEDETVVKEGVLGFLTIALEELGGAKPWKAK